MSNATLYRPLHSNIIFNISTNNFTGKSFNRTLGDQSLYRSNVIILSVLFFLIFLFNVLVLFTTLYQRRQSRMKIFIANLACADLLVALGALLPQLIVNITIQFHAPVLICKLFHYITILVTYNSAFALVSLSVDRMDAITRPLSVSQGTSRSFALLGVEWVCAALCSIPSLILARMEMIDSQPYCRLNLKGIVRIYMTYVATSVFIIPSVLIAFAHIRMVIAIYRASQIHSRMAPYRSRATIPNPAIQRCRCHVTNCALTAEKPDVQMKYKTAQQHSSSSFDHSYSVNFGNTISTTTIRYQGQRHVSIYRARIKSVKMTFVIVFVFVVCWCPYMIYNLLSTYQLIDVRAWRKATWMMQNLAPLNSAANPIIYLLFNAATCQQTFQRTMSFTRRHNAMRRRADMLSATHHPEIALLHTNVTTNPSPCNNQRRPILLRSGDLLPRSRATQNYS